MTTTTKTTVREQLLDFVRAQGWEPDPDKTVWSAYNAYRYGHSADAVRIQDPHAFRKPAANGGTWHLELDYNVKSEFHKTDNRLRHVYIELTDAEGKRVSIGAQKHNTRVALTTDWSTYYTSSFVYQLGVATSGPTGQNTLRQRAQIIVANPELVLWLAEEGRVNYELRVAEERRRREEETKARKRPLDITIERSEWDTLTSALRNAAVALNGAHGLTPLAEKIADAEQAIAALRAALPVTEAVH